MNLLSERSGERVRASVARDGQLFREGTWRRGDFMLQDASRVSR